MPQGLGAPAKAAASLRLWYRKTKVGGLQRPAGPGAGDAGGCWTCALGFAASRRPHGRRWQQHYQAASGSPAPALW